ncbi:pilus assembly protein PilP [Pseudoalteromonas sp. NBT06-2]|uniref:pilus assembly protein PilP n=1 Tax=Pseudoalteromonas sp. NBT06-2 TaxID=2025950 RepID=UPI000BA4FE60|nr:pilus assembly protein PilP [Pseudoalteromonas sp. NBT06-2]PAJ72631.1 pilus assembly protein PilP [Pseudoalteromonas sp. NBT06-2]
MKKITYIALPLILSGCFDDITAQQEFINKVQASTFSKVEPIPEIKKFEHFSYSTADLRSPFVAPKPEVIQDKLLQIQNCLHPDPRRKKEPLERYPLDNIMMKGTLGSGEETWALITASDDTLHRVARENYMGLYHGKVLQVHSSFIELLELIPDGAGCWKERLTKVEIVEATDASE